MSNGAANLTGRVKWFNNKSGFGFITVVMADDNEMVGKDIFAHHTSLKVDEEQFRYLVQGEYVEFNICEIDDNNKVQAADVRGVADGLLMCETRFANRNFVDDDGDDVKLKRNGRKQKEVELSEEQ